MKSANTHLLTGRVVEVYGENLQSGIGKYSRSEYIGGSRSEECFDEHLAKVGADHLWVATINSKVVGLIGLIVNEKEAEIEPIIVSKPYRNKGVGRRLVKRVIAEAEKLGIRLLSVKPVARNVEAIKSFYRQGFKNIGYIELFMDFSKRRWKKGLKIFDLRFNF